MIAIIDYGMGNLRSVQKGFERVGHEAVVTREPAVIDRASHVVLPGVGAFGDCMANVTRYGLVDPIHRAIQAGKPFLGICVGFQLLFTESEEFGCHKGLGLLPGKVKAIPLLKIGHPHIKFLIWDGTPFALRSPHHPYRGSILNPMCILSIHIM